LAKGDAMNGDHVRVRHPCETYCEECGASYHWNTPVPIQVFVEGNKGFLRIHQDCPIYRQDWRQRLLRTMEARLWSVWDGEWIPDRAGVPRRKR
jgi:hypothetical protein